MFMSDWKEQPDGSYWESIVSWTKFTSPIALLRCVKEFDGSYEALIREARTGYMIASHPKKCTLDLAMRQTIEMLNTMIPMENVTFGANQKVKKR